MGSTSFVKFFIIFSLFVFSVFPLFSDDESGLVVFDPKTEYCCGLNASMIIELPLLPEGEEYSYRAISQQWDIDVIKNFIWLKPKVQDDLLVLKIYNKQDKGIIIQIRSAQQCSIIMPKILVQELMQFPSKEAQDRFEAQFKVEEAKKETKEPEKEEVPEKSKRINLQTVFSAQGGTFNVNKKNYFNLNGDVIVAGKSQSGFFFQGAAMVKNNGFFNRFGQSIGIGLEPKSFGLFCFADLIQTKLKDFDLTINVQVRPAIRFKLSKMHLSAFFALPVVTDSYTGVDDTDDPTLGIYHQAIPHAGFEYIGLIGKRLLLNVNGLIGSQSIFKVGGGLDFSLGKNLLLSAHANYYNFGDQSLLIDAGYGKAFEVMAGVQYGIGKTNLFTELAKRLYYKPDYPLVIQAKKAKEETGKKSGLYITLSGNPTQGYCPLDVNFRYDFGGGQEPYTVEFKPAWKFEPSNYSNLHSTSLTNSFMYTEIGTYTAKAWITDSLGKKAESNEVQIVVLQPQGTHWNIIVTAGTGGKVTPGSTQVADGSDSPLFKITADSGYSIDYVLIDGQNKGPLNEYQFKNVTANHTLDAFFSNTVPGKYTINSSAGTGLSIDPSGSRQYNAGSNADYTVTVVDPDYAIDQVLVDGAPVATSPAAPYVYHFTNIQANHSINATSKRARYTITATAGANGSIDPSGAVKVNSGASQSFTITANSGYAIESVLVDGSPIAFTPSPFVYPFSNVTSDHTISATFKVATYTITIDHSFGGHTVPGTGTYTVNHGGSLSIQNVADAGQQIDYINVDGNGVPIVSTYNFSNVTANHTYFCAFKSSYLTLTWRSNNNNRRYIINGVDRGTSGSMQVSLNDPIFIEWRTQSGRVIEAENVLLDQVGQTIKNIGTSMGFGFNIIADTTISDTSRTIYFYEAYIREGEGTVLPLLESREAGYTIPVSVIASSEYTIDRILVNGVYLAGNVPQYYFNLFMDGDKVVEVYFRRL